MYNDNDVQGDGQCTMQKKPVPRWRKRCGALTMMAHDIFFWRDRDAPATAHAAACAREQLSVRTLALTSSETGTEAGSSMTHYLPSLCKEISCKL